MKKIKVIVDTLQNASGQFLSFDLFSHLIFTALHHLLISIYKTDIYIILPIDLWHFFSCFSTANLLFQTLVYNQCITARL